MKNFKIGDGVTVTTGPFKGLYGVIIFADETKEQILVRFNGSQQLYFLEEDLVLWSKAKEQGDVK